MGKIYINPFDWNYADDNILIYDSSSSKSDEEIKEMINEALNEALEDTLDNAVDGAVDEAISNMDIKLEGENLLYKLIVNGNENGEINIPKDQFLKSTSYDSENKKLIFVMETANGETTTEVSISELVASIEDGVGQIQGKLTQIDEKDNAQDEALNAKADASALENLATKEEVEAVDAKVDALEIPSIDGLAVASEVTEEIAAAVEPLATKAEVEAVDTKVDEIDLTPYATKQELAEAIEPLAAKTDIPDVSGLAVKTEVTEEINEVSDALSQFETQVDTALNAKADASALEPLAVKSEVSEEIAAAVEPLAAKTDIPDVSGLAVKSEVTEEINAAVAGIVIPDVSNFATETYVNDAIAEIQIPDVSEFATETYVNDAIEALDIPSIEGLAVASEVTAQIAAAVAGKANASDIPTRTSELENDSNFITSHQSLEEYAKKAYVGEKIAEVVGGAPETLDTLKELADVLTEDEGTIATVAAAIETKANAADVYTKANIDDKIGDLGEIIEVEAEEATYWEEGDELPDGVEVGDVKTPAVEQVTREKSVKEYVDESVQTVNEKPEVMVLERKYQALLTLLNLTNTDVNNVILNQELVDSNNVTFDDGSVDNIAVPETTKSKTITAELEPNTDLTLTSRYSVTINNTSEQPTDLTVTAPAVENYNAATITLNSGEYDTITVTDASLTVQNNATVQNVVITQETTKNLTINAMFADGATVTSDSNAAITLTSKNPEGEEVSVVLDAPGATVTMSGGNWVNVEAAVSANTLIINKNVHIENLNVTQGNVVVKVARQADIASVVEDYTLAAGCTIDHLHDDITASNVSNLTATGTHTLTEDIAKSGRFAPGIFASDDIVWNLNGHNITFTNTQGYANFLLRGSLHLEINGNGNVVNNAGDYGFWAAAEGVKIVINGGNFEAATHVLYAEKGTIEVNGGSFKLTNPDACDKDANGNFKFLLNCKDDNYTAGKANIIVRGGKFYGFNPAVTYGEPNAPVSYVPQGYHVVESVEDGMKVYTVVAD